MNQQKAILTVRLIRSFQHRNIKHIVMKDVDLHMSAKDFMQLINEGTSLYLCI